MGISVVFSRDLATTVAFEAMKTGLRSEIGDAVARLPDGVPTFWLITDFVSTIVPKYRSDERSHPDLPTCKVPDLFADGSKRLPLNGSPVLKSLVTDFLKVGKAHVTT